MVRKFHRRHVRRMSPVTGDQAQFMIHHRLALVRPQRREQEQILESETVLGVKEDTLQARNGFLRGLDKA
jgi:hypothetical protein